MLGPDLIAVFAEKNFFWHPVYEKKHTQIFHNWSTVGSTQS